MLNLNDWKDSTFCDSHTNIDVVMDFLQSLHIDYQVEPAQTNDCYWLAADCQNGLLYLLANTLR